MVDLSRPAATPHLQGNASTAARAAAATVRFPWQNASLPLEERVEALLARLTPTQKIAQLQSRPGNSIPELGVPAFDWQVGGQGCARALLRCQPRAQARMWGKCAGVQHRRAPAVPGRYHVRALRCLCPAPCAPPRLSSHGACSTHQSISQRPKSRRCIC